MRKVYFDLYNGEVVEPSAVMPAYYAVVNWRMKVVELKTCFRQRNIDEGGEEWKEDQLSRLLHDWSHLKKLQNSLRRHLIRSLFRRDNDFESKLAPHFVYLTIPGYR